jgi:hypothetical protein
MLRSFSNSALKLCKFTHFHTCDTGGPFFVMHYHSSHLKIYQPVDAMRGIIVTLISEAAT